MSKSFYKEALLDIVTEALEQPDKSVIIKHTGLNELKKALKQAQKQEKLLELYKELITLYEKLYDINLSTLNINGGYDAVDIIRVKQKIKELEDE